MISESFYWKDPLLKTASWLESSILNNEADAVHLERELFFGFYAVRKLLDTFKVSDSIRQLQVSVDAHKNLKRVDYLNSHRLDELYDLETSNQERQQLLFICNQFIHSFVFAPLCSEDGRFLGCFIASDRLRNTKLYFVPVGSIIEVFRNVGNDYPHVMQMRRNAKTQDWEVVRSE